MSCELLAWGVSLGVALGESSARIASFSESSLRVRSSEVGGGCGSVTAIPGCRTSPSAVTPGCRMFAVPIWCCSASGAAAARLLLRLRSKHSTETARSAAIGASTATMKIAISLPEMVIQKESWGWEAGKERKGEPRRPRIVGPGWREAGMMERHRGGALCQTVRDRSPRYRLGTGWAKHPHSVIEINSSWLLYSCQC
ncbi:hypothetical protein BKA62DRAFT_257203 [Auriculariales sp. MPI-PUGE-AT-0066]|nr:hypothetical protein BKA62DRAFT_257203 [Auriculariales sp. MPI-PUGE-AT-0066]